MNADTSTANQAFAWILWLRCLVLIFSVLEIFVFQFFTVAQSPFLSVVILLVMAISIGFGFWRQRVALLISGWEFAGQILLDIFFVAAIVAITGGASNPMISYLLILLALAATVLSRTVVMGLAIVSIVVYVVLLLSGSATMDHSVHMGQAGGMDAMGSFQLHLVGMLVVFVVSALLLATFVTRMADAIRTREKSLSQARENSLRDEQLVAIGTLAAGTAHALGTPLSTMAVLLAELDKFDQQQLQQQPLKDDVSLLNKQVQRCKNTLAQLTRFFNEQKTDAVQIKTVAEFIEGVRDYLVNVHPGANIQYHIDDAVGCLSLRDDATLTYAVINLIENAIRLAGSEVIVSVEKNSADGCLEISIRDDGPGFPLEVIEKIGQPFVSTRSESMGLGIFLANATAERMGGKIEAFNLTEGGALTVMAVPLSD